MEGMMRVVKIIDMQRPNGNVNKTGYYQDGWMDGAWSAKDKWTGTGWLIYNDQGIMIGQQMKSIKARSALQAVLDWLLLKPLARGILTFCASRTAEN